MTVDEMLGESIDAARKRERSAFDDAAGYFGKRVVLHGAGKLGRKILAVLQRHAIAPLAFSDNNEALHGTFIDGVPVLKTDDAVTHFGANAAFVVTVFRGYGDAGMEARIGDLRARGCVHVRSWLSLAWKYGDEILPHYGACLPSELLSRAASLAAVNELWADRSSKEIFRQQLSWRLHDDFRALSAPVSDQYFPRNIIKSLSNEELIDAGAYDGDTLRALSGRFKRAWAIEPDPVNASRLRASVDDSVEVIECALGASRGETLFAGEGGVAASFSPTGVSVQVRTIDELFEHQSPTFIKLDIEGAELEALEGGEKTLMANQPLVAVCLYHIPGHFFSIPRYLASILDHHRFFLRAHQNDGFELVCYAVPNDRCLCS